MLCSPAHMHNPDRPCKMLSVPGISSEPVHLASRAHEQLPATPRGAQGTQETTRTQQTCPGSHGCAACCLGATSCAIPSTIKVREPSIHLQNFRVAACTSSS